ncbi:MAG: hypothetical protein HY298_20885 [Verrucomicrobia bacterium]|nr:hypothetical protein [Verrucomicrobiota bacterium]
MSEVMTAPQPVERKCRLEEVFDANFIGLIRLVPRNPFVRALILKLAGKMPGPERETFEQIKEWVETNCDKRVRPASVRRGRNNPDDGIAINVEFSETEYGRADYSVPRSGSEEFRIDAEDLMEMVQAAVDAGEGVDGIVEVIAEKIDGDAWNQCNPDLDNYGDYDYSEQEATDSGNCGTSYSKNEIRNAVLAFVRERHPELAAEL